MIAGRAGGGWSWRGSTGRRHHWSATVCGGRAACADGGAAVKTVQVAARTAATARARRRRDERRTARVRADMSHLPVITRVWRSPTVVAACSSRPAFPPSRHSSTRTPIRSNSAVRSSSSACPDPNSARALYEFTLCAPDSHTPMRDRCFALSEVAALEAADAADTLIILGRPDVHAPRPARGARRHQPGPRARRTAGLLLQRCVRSPSPRPVSSKGAVSPRTGSAWTRSGPASPASSSSPTCCSWTTGTSSPRQAAPLPSISGCTSSAKTTARRRPTTSKPAPGLRRPPRRRTAAVRGTPGA